MFASLLEMRFVPHLGATLVITLCFFASNTGSGNPDSSSDFAELLHTAEFPVGCEIKVFGLDPVRCNKASNLLNLSQSEYIGHESSFVATVTHELEKCTNEDGYSYAAVLIAALSGDRRFVAPLRKLASVEATAHLPYRYANRAIQRIENGICKPPLLSNEGEICRYIDPVFRKIHYLRER